MNCLIVLLYAADTNQRKSAICGYKTDVMNCSIKCIRDRKYKKKPKKVSMYYEGMGNWRGCLILEIYC